MERLLEEISFTASDRPSTAVEIEGADVRERVGELARKADPGKFGFQHFLPFADLAKGR
jgi:ATP-dependent HslUV protease ATP-binding subunit HslU